MPVRLTTADTQPPSSHTWFSLSPKGRIMAAFTVVLVVASAVTRFQPLTLSALPSTRSWSTARISGQGEVLFQIRHQYAQYQQGMLSQWRERFSTAPPSTEPAGASSNRTLVVLIGQARGGEEAWSSLFQNVLDVSPRLASDCLPLHPDYCRQTKPTWRCCLAKRPTAAQSKLRCCTSERSLCGWCPSMRTG